MARACLTDAASFEAYSGSRSGPRITTASTISAMNSQPLTPAMPSPLPLLARAGQRECDADRLTPAADLHRDGVAHALGADRHHEVVGVGDPATVELDDDVPGLDPRLARRALGIHGRPAVAARLGQDADTVTGERAVEHDTDHGVLGLAGLDELFGRLDDLVARDREADADVAGLGVGGAGDPRDGRVHADDLAGHVEQGPTAVAGVDRGVGLDGVDEGLLVAVT